MNEMKYDSWSLNEALDLIRELQPKFHEINYHITLGGGVLNRGCSEKDLDLFIIPFNGWESSTKQTKELLYKKFGSWGKALRDNPDYGPDAFPHALEMLMYNFDSKRIDVFIQ